MVLPRTILALLLTGALAAPTVAQRVELLDFYLTTCPPCRAMAPTVDQLEAEGVAVRRINGSERPDLAQRFGVSRYPTFIIVADGQESARVVGMADIGRMRGMLAQAQEAVADTPALASSRTFAAGPDAGRAFTVGPDAAKL